VGYEERVSIMSHYKDLKELQSESNQGLKSQYKEGITCKTKVLSSPNVRNNTFNLKVLETMTKQKSLENFKVPKMKIDMSEVSALDKIKLHKQTREVIFTDMLQSTLYTKKLQATLEKLRGYWILNRLTIRLGKRRLRHFNKKLLI
jgi:hypothetical protein